LSILSPAVLAAAETTEHANPLVPEWNELFWSIVSFLVLLLLVAKYVFPRIRKVFSERSANIEGKLELAENERQQANQLLAAYENKLKEANTEAARILEQARANADRLETELRAKAEEQAQRIVERAQETINAERERALQSLRSEVGGLAVDLAERVVSDSLDRDRQLRLVDQYIKDLPSAGGAAVSASGGSETGSTK
jgi:F-type H+-transporting ATPase subunit b